MLIGHANYILLGVLVYACPILIVLSLHPPFNKNKNDMYLDVLK